VTTLRERKTKLVFESADDSIRERGKYRPVVIEAHPFHATVRLKGLRQGFDVPWSAIWSMGAKAEVERIRREKKAEKAGKR
jgi:hypothetical protein